MNFKFNNQTSDYLQVEDSFEIPVFPYEVDFHETEHSNTRIKKRGTFKPLEFDVPFNLYNNQNKTDRDTVLREVTKLLSSGVGWFSLDDADWQMYGQFTGPFYVPKHINVFTVITLKFVSPYSFKFSKTETVLTGSTITIPSTSFVPITPYIELTELTSNDVQVSVTGDEFRRIRLSGTVPALLTIDIPNERIYETNSKVDRINLLHLDSSFEDFKVKSGDVIVTNNGTMKIKYRELML